MLSVTASTVPSVLRFTHREGLTALRSTRFRFSMHSRLLELTLWSNRSWEQTCLELSTVAGALTVDALISLRGARHPLRGSRFPYRDVGISPAVLPAQASGLLSSQPQLSVFVRCTALMGFFAASGELGLVYILFTYCVGELLACLTASGLLGVVYIVTYHVGELLACWAVRRLLLGSRQAVGCLAASGGQGKGRATGGEPRAGQWAGCWCAWRQAACWAVGGRLAGLASGVLGSGRAAVVLGSKRRAGHCIRRTAGVIVGQRGSGGVCSPACKVIFPPQPPLSSSAAAALPSASGSTPGALGLLPGALPELPVFSTASPAVALTLPSQATASAAPSDSMLSLVLQTLAGQPQAATTSGERVMVGDGLPAIPKRLLAKTRNWEYVDLTELS